MSHYYTRLFASLVCSLWCVAACAVTASTTQLTFGPLHVGASATQSVTLTNTGSGTSAGLVFFSASLLAGADFSLQTDCPDHNSPGSGLPVGSSCSYQVTFAPSQVGGETQTLNINVYSGQNPAPLIQQLSIDLSGTGAAFMVGLSPASLNFGSVIDGQSSPAQTIKITNNDTNPFYFSAPVFTGNFASPAGVSGCGSSGLTLLSPGQSCTVSVSFTPQAIASETGSFSVNVYSASPQQLLGAVTASLSGTGTPPITLSPGSLSFGYISDGQASPAQSVKFTNIGSTNFFVSSGAFTGDFASPSGGAGCGAGGLTSLSPGQSCAVRVSFTPRAVGAETGTVSVNVYNSAQTLVGPLVAVLSGVGHPLTVATGVSFGFQKIGTTVTVPTVIANASPAAVNIGTITLNGTNFAQSNNCIGSLAPGTQCVINVSYTPTLKTASTGSITVADADATSPQTIQLTGAGTSSKLTVSPANARGLKNSTLQFTASKNGEIFRGPIRWSSSNPAVATISSSGKATLLSTGTTAITAQHGGQSDSEEHGGQRGSTVLAVTLAAQPVFTAQPTDTGVSAIINSGAGVKVRMLDLLGDPLPGQSIAMTIGNNAAVTPGPPYATGTLSGALIQTTDATGTATFPDLKIDWWGPTPDGRPGYTLAAAATPSSGPVNASSGSFNELRVGDRCLGPKIQFGENGPKAAVCLPPGDANYCADTDGDGLNDAWEMAGGIDMNGDGIITDAQHDLLLPGADPNKPDIFVYYDWMDYGQDDESCASDSQCTALGAYHHSETCNNVGQCVYACTTDADCTSRTPATAAHTGERCISNVCEHTHDPLALEPNTFKYVVDRFAAHGINLHILRGKAQPHSHVVSFRTNNQMTLSCEGASLGAGTAGPGKYAESFYDLKGSSNPDTFLVAYHYALFGHLSGCDSIAHCPANPGNSSDCTTSTLKYGQSGVAELEGNDLIISMGDRINHVGISPHFQLAGTFMHELGHNLGMRHDGHLDRLCTTGGGCPAGDTCADIGDGLGQVCHETVGGVLGGEEPNYKPNYLSIMNYMYSINGIPIASGVGGRTQLTCTADSDCGDGGFCMEGNVCGRLDYSRQTLPTGGATPGALDESNLDDTVGLGSGTADMFAYTDGTCHVCPQLAPTTGPVDWMGAGLANNPSCQFIGTPTYTFTDTGVHADIDSPNSVCEGTPHDVLHGHTDWPDMGGLPFVYTFQCNATGSN